MTKDRLRSEIVAALREAATTHERGDFADIGAVYDRLSQQAGELSDIDPDLRVAIDFLDCWYDSSNHDWQFYEPLGQYDWPRLSLSLANSLEKSEPIEDGIRQVFTFAPRRRLWSRLRALLKGSV